MFTVAQELPLFLLLLREACIDGQLPCVKKICQDNELKIAPGTLAKSQVFEALLGAYARTKSAMQQCILEHLVGFRPNVLTIPFKRHRSLLHMAVAAGLPPAVLDDLITRGAVLPTMTPMIWAILAKHKATLDPEGSPCDACRELHPLAKRSSVVPSYRDNKRYRGLSSDAAEKNPLFELGGEGVTDAASSWLCLKKHCARLRVVDAEGCNVMHVLCAWAKRAALQLLSNEETRADVEPLLSRRDSLGRLPLHYACMDPPSRELPRESPAMRKRIQHTLKLLPSANRRQEILHNLDAPTTRTSLMQGRSDLARLVEALIRDTPQELLFARDNFHLTPMHYTLVASYPHLEAIKVFPVPPPEVDDLQLFIACWGNMTLMSQLQRQKWHLDMVCSKKWRAARDQARSVLQGGDWPYDHEVLLPTPPNELPDPRQLEASPPTPPPADVPWQADRRRPRSPSPVSHGHRCSDAADWHDQKRMRRRSRSRSETRSHAGFGSLKTETRDWSYEREERERSGRGDSLSKYRPARLWSPSRSRSRSRSPPHTHERSRPSPLRARITSPVITPSSKHESPRSPAKSAAKPVPPPVIVPSLSGLGFTEPMHDAATTTSMGRDSGFMEMCSVDVSSLRKENGELGQKAEELGNMVEALKKEKDHVRTQLDVLRKDVAVLEAELGVTDVREVITAVKGLKQERDVNVVRLSELGKEVEGLKSLDSEVQDLRQTVRMFNIWIQQSLETTGAQDMAELVVRAKGYQQLREEQESRLVVKADATDGVVAVAVKGESSKVNGGPAGRYDHSDW